MGSFFTQTAQHRKGHRLTPVAFIILLAAVIVVFSSIIGKAAYRSPSDNIGNIITGSLPPASSLPGNDLFMHRAEQGREGIELAARLSQNGGFIQRPIIWQIFKRDADFNILGISVFKGEAAIVETALPPGTYRVEAKYGYARATHDITILPGTRIGLTFNLNVGGVRTLSRVVGVDASHYSGAKHTIIALPENKPEKVITNTAAQGEIIRLAAGKYRIESRFDSGNTLAVAKVTVKSGILTSLNIDHQAALAKLSLLTTRHDAINWQVHSHKGNWTKTGKNLNPTKTPTMILAPGRYTFSALIGHTKFSHTVSLAQGKATIIVLGK